MYEQIPLHQQKKKTFLQSCDGIFIQYSHATETSWLQLLGWALEQSTLERVEVKLEHVSLHHEYHAPEPLIYPKVSHTGKDEVLITCYSEDCSFCSSRNPKDRGKGRLFFHSERLLIISSLSHPLSVERVSSDFDCMIVTYNPRIVHFAKNI